MDPYDYEAAFQRLAVFFGRSLTANERVGIQFEIAKARAELGRELIKLAEPPESAPSV